MNDLISREALMQELTKKVLFPGIVRQTIEEAPTVDAVEIVRCKNCKFHYWEQEPCHGKTVHLCRKLDAEVTSDFYCAAGKAREK